MLDGMSDSIQRSRIENLHSREVDRQSPTGLIFYSYYRSSTYNACRAQCCFTSSVRLSLQCWFLLHLNKCMYWRLSQVFNDLVGYYCSFLSPRLYKISVGTHLLGTLNTQGWEKFVIFNRNCHLSWKQY